MQANAYDGYFVNGRFYASGKAIQIPERRRIIVTILDDVRAVDTDKKAAWDDFKQMVKTSAHENHLLTDDVFCRSEYSREFIDFTGEAGGL